MALPVRSGFRGVFIPASDGHGVREDLLLGTERRVDTSALG